MPSVCSTMKICGNCKLQKEYSEFYKRKVEADGHCYRCKDCERVALRSYYVRNIVKNKERIKKHAEENKERYSMVSRLRNKRRYYVNRFGSMWEDAIKYRDLIKSIDGGKYEKSKESIQNHS